MEGAGEGWRLLGNTPNAMEKSGSNGRNGRQRNPEFKLQALWVKIEGLRKAIKDKVTGDVRFVEIPEIDLGACAGFHVENTKDIKLFKILSHEKIKGNYTRFFFIAGDRAIKDYAFKHELSKVLCHIFSCKDYEILTMLNKSLEEKKKTETEMKMIASEFAELLGEKLMREAEEINGYKFVVYTGDKVTVQYLPRYIAPEDYILITGSEDSYSIISNKICGGWRGAGCPGVPGVSGPVLLNHFSQPFGKVEVSPNGEEALCRREQRKGSLYSITKNRV